MLGEVYSRHDGKRLTYDSVEFKKKYVYFSNSLLNSTFVIGGVPIDETLKKDFLLNIKECFYTGRAIHDFSLRKVGELTLILKELESFKPQLGSLTLSDLKEDKLLYLETNKGVHKVLDVSKTYYSVLIELVSFYIVIESEDNEIVNSIYSYLNRLTAEERRLIINKEYLEECLYIEYDKAIQLEFEIKKKL